MATISGSVGRGGMNARNDVTTIQSLLNNCTAPPSPLLAVDGVVGPKTIGAIENYQRNVVRGTVDGRVDPNGATLRSLNSTQRPGTGGGSFPPPPPAGGGNMKVAQYKSAMEEEFRRAGKQDWWNDFATALEDSIQSWGRLFVIVERAEEARKIAQFYLWCRREGMAVSNVKQVLQLIYTSAEPRWGKWLIESIVEPASKLAPIVSNLEKAGKVVKFITFLFGYIKAWQQGDYHLAFVEIYKEFMTSAIPWANFIDGVETFVSGVWPGSKDSKFWKVLRTLNLVGLGANAIDAFGVLIQSAITGNWDYQRFKRLEERMRSSPAQIFVEIGSDLANALAKIDDMNDGKFSEFLYNTTNANWLDYLKSYAPSAPSGVRRGTT